MITIVVASYRYGHLAAHAIESLLAQTRQPDRVLFVDDAAGDCGHLPEIYPEVEYVFREKNLGIVDNFQDMLNRVTTDKCMFLGADNWLRPDALEALDKVDADIVTYDILVTGELKGGILARHPGQIGNFQGDLYWSRKGGHHGSMLYNTQKAKDSGGYRSPPGRTLEDYVLFNAMVREGARVAHVPEAFLHYRRHARNFNGA